MKMMKSLLALCVFTCLVGFSTISAIAESSDPILETPNETEMTVAVNATTDALLEELNCLESEEAVAAFFKEHYDFESDLTGAASNSFYAGGCGSWITVARCVQYRQCWVGTTANGTRYGFYWQNRFTC